MKMGKIKIAITLGLLCMILTIAISIQFKTMKSEDSVVSATIANNELKDQLLKWKDKYEQALNEYEKTEINLEKIRNQATQNDSSAIEIEQQIKENKKILGLTEVTGNGIVITLEDNSTATQKNIISGSKIADYVVHDIDLIILINELWNAGAEAISINGHRIISTSSITCDGNTVKINGQTTGTPFEIKAIGNGLYGAIARPGGYFELMGDTGVTTSITNQNNIVIPKYNGAINSDYIKNK